MTQNNLSFLYNTSFYGVYYSETDNTLKIERISVPKYDNINILQEYLLQVSAPIRVSDLRKIGLTDIVGNINIWQSSMARMGEWPYLEDSNIIEITELQQRLLDLLFDLFVTHYTSKYIYSTKNEHYAISIIQTRTIQLEAFGKIKQILKNEAENNPYISIEERNIADQLCCNVYFDGRIWIQLYGNMSNRFVIYKVNSQYELPPYSININSAEKPYALYARFDKKEYRSDLTLKEVTDIVFKQLEDIGKHKITIQNIFSTVLKENLLSEEIIYDPVRKCYCLSKEKEQQLFIELIPQESECKELAKYISFPTLMATLQSGKMRMNSIVAMNDKTEMFFLSDTIKNFQESIAEEGDNLYWANQNFITSFSERIDELDMWRFYGDNAHGVCMVFEVKEMYETKIKEVLYINKENNEKIKQMNKILSELKENKINFRFPILDSYKPFYKSEDFKNEAEHRLLTVSDKHKDWIITQPHNILSPYIDRDLGLDIQNRNTEFPLILKRIILGPEMSNKEINKIQLKQFLLGRYSSYNIEICNSTISTYR